MMQSVQIHVSLRACLAAHRVTWAIVEAVASCHVQCRRWHVALRQMNRVLNIRRVYCRAAAAAAACQAASRYYKL